MAVRLLTKFLQFTASSLPHSLSYNLRRPALAHSLSPTLIHRFSDISMPISAGEPNSSSEGARVLIKSSLNPAELAKFSAISETWWDDEGPFKPLHALNPTRLAIIRSTLCNHFRKDPNSIRPFEGLKFVDVGYGGGILSEVCYFRQ